MCHNYTRKPAANLLSAFVLLLESKNHLPRPCERRGQMVKIVSADSFSYLPALWAVFLLEGLVDEPAQTYGNDYIDEVPHRAAERKLVERLEE